MVAKYLKKFGAWLAIWGFIKAIWDAIGHIGNVQTLWDMISAAVQYWPSMLRGAAWVATSWWFPLCASAACLVAWWILARKKERVRTKENLSLMQPESSIPALIRFLITADHTCHSENQWASGPVRFLHAKVSIDHGSVLTSAYLTKIAKGNEVKWEHGPEQLSFGDHTPGDPLPRMLYHGFSYHLDVLVIDCKTNEIQVCNDRRDWRRRPRMHEIFAEKVDYILTIGLAGDGAESTTVELRFSWTGNWQTSFLHSQPSPTGKRVPSPEAKECLNRAAELLKHKKDGIIMNFHGLYRARAYDLQSNDDLIWVCDKLVAHGYSHPFEGLDECMPQSEWLDFMKWGHLHAKWDFGQEGGYLHAAIQWSNERGRPLDEKKVWRGVMAEVLDEHRYG